MFHVEQLRTALRRFRRHVREWRAVLKENWQPLTWRTWLKMVRALFSGRVPPQVWRRRARTCNGCFLFDRELRRCAGPWVNGKPSGCGCYIPWLLHTRRPYAKGCWGRTYVGDDVGWE
jgi:hypothetical protein